MSKGFHSLIEAMTADQISAAQSEHYALDDQIRRSIGRLTAEQKQRVINQIKSMLPSEG